MMADQHPYRNDASGDSEPEEETEDQVVFDISGKVGAKNGDHGQTTRQEKIYYLSGSENPDSACGVMCLQFPSLSRYATLNIFIVILTVLCCFQGMFYAFWISIITSIEKQYELSSAQIGFVTALGELGRIACLLGLSLYGELVHRPRWIALSAITVVFSYILMVIPSLFPDPAARDISNVEICSIHHATENASSTPLPVPTKCSNFDDRYSWRTAALSIYGISHFLAGTAGGIPIVYGIAVIQDHFIRKDSALYLGIHFVGKVLGPVLGFLLGALCTAMLIGSTGRQFDDQDPRWLNVRAWHVSLGIVVISLLNLGAALSMLALKALCKVSQGLFENYAGRRRRTNFFWLVLGTALVQVSESREYLWASRTKGDRVCLTAMYDRTRLVVTMLPSQFTIQDPEAKIQNGVPHVNLSRPVIPYRKPLSLRLVKEDIKKLLFNQIFLTRVAAITINVFILSGFYVFLPKYLEAQFYVQPNAANIATAIAILLPTGCGIIVGCFIYRYCDFKPRHSTMITIVTSILFFAGFLILIAFRCETRKMSGARTDSGLVDVSQSCNAACDCTDTVFSPVCDPSTQLNYFSLCRAGCHAPPAVNSSHNELTMCGCAGGTSLNWIPRKFCSITCNRLWPFIFILFLILFACSIPTVGSVMLIYRTVPNDLMLMAHIFTAVCVGMFALFPSPMVFGEIMDSSCSLWSAQGCSGINSPDGACLLHNNDEMAFRLSGTIAGLKILAILIEGYMLWKSRKLEFDEIEPSIMWSPDAVRLAFTETVGR